METKVRNEKAQSNWFTIRDVVFGPCNSSKNAEKFRLNSQGYSRKRYVEPLVLHHGTELVRCIPINYTQSHVSIKSVVYNPSLKTYILIFTDGNLCGCRENEQQQEIYKCNEPMLYITYSEKYKSYAAVCQDNTIRILSEDFNLINVIPFSGTLFGIQYNKFTSEVVTYGKGCLTVWLFRAAGTLLILKKILHEKLSPHDDISHIFIENTSSKNQRCFASLHNSILIYNLNEGKCIRRLSAIHNSDITQVLFYGPLKILITAAKDGCIKAWDSSWNLNCLFVGHTSVITALTVFPYGPYFMSASLDGTFRIWSLDNKDQIKCQTSHAAVQGLHCQFGVDIFYSFTEKSLSLWRVNNLHSPFLVLGVKSICIKRTTNPLISPVSYCICNDASVRIICPVNGDVVTVFISPDLTSITDAEYLVSQDLLFVLLTDGRIVKASTTTNPCKIINIWNGEQTLVPSACTCFSLYEYMTFPSESQNRWEGVIGKVSTSSHSENQVTLLLGGCRNGSIVMFDWFNDKNVGRIVFNLEAHQSEVIIMSSNNRLNQLATASKDKTLKIWRVFPFAHEVLTPLLMFHHTSFVTSLMFSQHVLVVICQDISKSLHTVVVYNTKESKKARLIEHDVTDDHTDIITSISTCPKLRLIASSSMDRTVRIWNADNKLIRVLELNEVAHSIAFCSERGDLLLGIGTNVHYVNHERYLPKIYLYQMVAMMFNQSHPIPVIPISEDSVLSVSERTRALKAYSSYIKFMQFIDDIPIVEKKEREEEDTLKKKEFAILEARDHELNLIKNGQLKSKKRQKLSNTQKDEAFEKYLSTFYNRPDINYPEDDIEAEIDDKFIVQLDDSYKPTLANEGFFSVNAKKSDIERIRENLRKTREEDLERRKIAKATSIKDSRSLSIRTNAVDATLNQKPVKHPLSASTTYTERLKALKKVTSTKSIENVDYNFISGKLPMIDASCEQYPNNKEITRKVNRKIVAKVEQSFYHQEPIFETLPVAPDGFLPNSVVVALYKELRREMTQEEQIEKWKPRQLTEKQLEELNAFKKKQNPSIIAEHLSEMENEITSQDDDLDTPPLTPPESPIQNLGVVQKKKIIQPRKPIQKLVSKPVIIEKPKYIPREPTPPSPPPPLPLPDYISQFKGSDWFEACFPEIDNKTFKKGMTRNNFVSLLLEHLVRLEDYDMKTKIVAALTLLYHQDQFDEETTNIIRGTILGELNLPGEASPVSNSHTQLKFIKNSLQLILELKDITNVLIVELMVQFILGTIPFRKEIEKIFEELGVQDLKDYFIAELYTAFDVSQVESNEQRTKLHEMCFDWLSLWTKKLREHVTSLSGKICRASRGKAVSGTAKPENANVILKKNGEHSKKFGKQNRHKSIAIVSDNFVTEAANHITPLEAINYFCEMEYEKHLERARLEALAAQASAAATEETKEKNTVLMLPKVEGYVSLARLGETHRSKCHPERETSLTHGLALPPIENKDGIHNLILHLKTLTLTPFPDELDDLIYAPTANSELVTLRYAQKYFIPSNSFVSKT